MWDCYENDESFQLMARGKLYHDAKLLAKVLYGKAASRTKTKESSSLKEKKAERTKDKISFSCEPGTFSVDSSLVEESEETNYVSRTTDYSFQPVKTPLDFNSDGVVKTDVLIYDRKATSEYDEDREQFKDDLLAWKERYQNRQLQKQLLEN